MAKIKRRPPLRETVTFDSTPCFRGHRIILTECRAHGWKGILNSADRRQGVAEKYGKLSQAYLSAAWVLWSTKRVLIRGWRGAPPNPANTPGHSTHELRSDGVAYAGPVGRPLSWWQLGLDVTDADGLIRAAHSLGYSLFRPYPSGSEEHHVNLRKSPTAILRKRGH
ncbi:MAG: hypothetical protein AAGC46_16155 [Solirubrobacteraceae bacterium]|nr:hypothetical protein [Patulibacter sp.]